MAAVSTEIPPVAEPKKRRHWHGGRKTHGLKTMRRELARLTTKRLDGRSKIAIAVRKWKADYRLDLGGDLTTGEETVLEPAAQAWVMVACHRGHSGEVGGPSPLKPPLDSA